MTRLLVVSHTPHHLATGGVAGWGATVRELDHLAGLVDELVHVAPLHAGPPTGESRHYRASNVRFVSVPPGGGAGVAGRLDAARRLRGWWRAIAREARDADAVHIRLPAGLAAVALAVCCTRARPAARWYKYAGEWGSYPGEPWAWRLQRVWLTRLPWLHRGTVTVNGTWPGQPSHVVSFDNPCLSEAELAAAAAADTGGAVRQGAPLRLLFAGRLEPGKRPELAVAATAELHRRGIPAELAVVGDGPLRVGLEAAAAPLGAAVRFHGWLDRSALDVRYREADLLLVPSRTEGFPKVAGEAMAHGVVPVSSPTHALRQLLDDENCGTVVPQASAAGWADAIAAYAADPERWPVHSRRARAAARRFTYEAHVERVGALLGFDPAPVDAR